MTRFRLEPLPPKRPYQRTKCPYCRKWLSARHRGRHDDSWVCHAAQVRRAVLLAGWDRTHNDWQLVRGADVPCVRLYSGERQLTRRLHAPLCLLRVIRVAKMRRHFHGLQSRSFRVSSSLRELGEALAAYEDTNTWCEDPERHPAYVEAVERYERKRALTLLGT